MINITCITKKTQYKHYLKVFQNKNVSLINHDDLLKYLGNKKSKIEKNKLFEEYLIFNYLYLNGGMFINGEFKFIRSIELIFNYPLFISANTYDNIATNIIYVKEKKNKYIKEILEKIEKNKYKNITDIICDIIKEDKYKICGSVFNYKKEMYVFPHEYFYPIDYENVGKDINDNVKALYIDREKKIPAYQASRVKMIMAKSDNIITKILSKTPKELMKSVYYRLPYKAQKTVKSIVKFKIKKQTLVPKAIQTLKEYKEKGNVDYIIIHNPYWLGVTAATKELFTNLVPLEELGLKEDVEKVAKAIIKLNVKQVIFSAFNFGWDKLAIRLKELNPDIKIKVFWHGSHSQVIEEINWKTNTMVINLHKKGIIDVFATCKESLVDFYKAQGYNTAFIMNTVRIDKKLKNFVSENKEHGKKLRIGLYSANADWRKNAFTQIMAVSTLKNPTLEMVPINPALNKLAKKRGIHVEGSIKSVKREELLKRLAKNDINLYVTFSECAPMLPIESLEMGTLCILGSNHHYFAGTKLYDYLVVEKEDSELEIAEKIKTALAHEEEIFELYKEWKKENDKLSKKSVQDFLNM